MVGSEIEYGKLVLVRGVMNQNQVLVVLHILKLSHWKKVLNSTDRKDVLIGSQLEDFSENVLPHVKAHQDSSLSPNQNLIS